MIDNPIRGRCNAWLLAALDGYMHRKFGDVKSCLLSNAPPVVVELGPGAGANLPEGTRVRALQRLLARPWRWLFEGCDLCRDTGSTLRAAGFARVDLQPFVLSTVFVPIRHQIAAVCVS